MPYIQMDRTLTDYIGFRISSSLRERLEEVAAQKNKSVSKVIRETLRDMFDNVKQTDPKKPPDLNPPPGPKESKKTQKSLTESFYSPTNIDPEDRKELIEEFKKKTKVCQIHDEKYIGKECPYCKKEREEDNK